MKEFLTTMTKFNPVLSAISFDHGMTYHPNNDEFPHKEEEFKIFS